MLAGAPSESSSVGVGCILGVGSGADPITDKIERERKTLDNSKNRLKRNGNEPKRPKKNENRSCKASNRSMND